MNPESVSSDSDTYTDAVDTPEFLETSNPDAKLLTAERSASDSSTQQWHQLGEQIRIFFQALPGYVTHFFEDYKRPLGTIGIIIGAIIFIKVMLALLDAIDDIPLISPTLELIGIGYTAWFVYRYLLRASNRQELMEEFKSLKNQVLGS
ncbi:MAG TPA: CAAD domain-containing protein [Coleofasciculaceae cyanobacterium]